MTTDEFIQKSTVKHGGKYSYSKTVYTGSKSTVIITCDIHGDFECKAGNHVNGKGRCEICMSLINASKKSYSTSTYISKVQAVHGDRYDYSKVVYTRAQHKVTVICKTHGEFNVAAYNHLNGRGCPDCKKDALKMSLQEFIVRSNKMHNNGYDYSKVNYTGSNVKVDILCKKHGLFSQTPSSHVRGHGCKDCAARGYSPSKRGTFYVLILDEITKVGITNRKIKDRLSQIKQNSGKEFSLLIEYSFDDGRIAQSLEKEVLLKLRSLYKSPEDVFDGYTECFINVNKVDLINIVDQLIPFIKEGL